MHRTYNRIGYAMLSMFVCVVLLLLVVPLADDSDGSVIHIEPITGSAGDNITYTLSKPYTNVVFEGNGEMYDFSNKARPWAKDSVTTVEIGEGITSVGGHVFYGMGSLTSVTLPSTLYMIDNGAFSSSGLTEITIPDSVKIIGNLSFAGTKLTDITIPDNVESLGASALSKCKYLKNVIIGDGIDEISQGLLSNTPSLETLELGSGVTSIKRWFINSSGLETLTIPASVSQISYSAFFTNGAGNLKTIIVEEGNSNYCSNESHTALYNKDMSEIIRYLPSNTADLFSIPDSVRSISSYAFGHCTHLKDIEISENVTFIGSHAFYGCSSLGSLSIPDSVVQIDANGVDVDSLSVLRLGSGIEKITSKQIPSLSIIEELYVGEKITEIELRALEFNPNLAAIVVDEDNEKYCSINGSLYNKTQTHLYIVPCKITGSYAISDYVEYIGSYALHNSELLWVSLGHNLAVIGDYAFSESAIRSVRIPSSAVLIGEHAFYNCVDLEKIYFESDVRPSICEGAFFLDDTYSGSEVRVYSKLETGFLDYYSVGISFVYTSIDVPEDDLMSVVTNNPAYVLAAAIAITLLSVIIWHVAVGRGRNI